MGLDDFNSDGMHRLKKDGERISDDSVVDTTEIGGTTYVQLPLDFYAK
jgi:hypothetical protein